MVIRALLVSLVVAAAINSCARSNPRPTGAVINFGGCPSQRPTSWPNSRFQVSSGDSNTTLDAETGTLIFEVRVDSMPGLQGAQVSLRNRTIQRDIAYSDSTIRVTAPAGRYSLRARRIAAQTLQDSINVRSGFVDTVKVTLGREVVCLDAKALTE
jgi:hypothetical protein